MDKEYQIISGQKQETLIPEKVLASMRLETHSLLDALLVTDPQGYWKIHAICQEENPALFFSPRTVEIEKARSICHQCPVWTDCLEYAFNHPLEAGILGGLTQNERFALLTLLEQQGTSYEEKQNHELEHHTDGYTYPILIFDSFSQQYTLSLGQTVLQNKSPNHYTSPTSES